MAKHQSGGPDGGLESGRLRDRIDSGALGDKVDYPDPAASPLPTDSEAGGAPVRERDVPGPAGGRARAAESGKDRGPSRRWPYAVGLGALVLLAVAALFAFALPQ